jgi:hypothetical protein
MLEKLWDDVAGGSPPDKGLKQLRKSNSGQYPDVPDDARRIMERRFRTGAYQSPSQTIAIKKPQRIGMLDIDSPAGTPSSLGSTPPASPSMASPSMASPSSYSKEKENIWRSVFHPGQNKVMRKVGSDKFDKAQPNAPSVYDWLYSADSKSEYR